MACVVLGVCGFGGGSFLGSPNLLLGPVLTANPAGFTCPVQEIQLYLAGVVSFLFHNKFHIHLHQRWGPITEHWSNTANVPHSAMRRDGGRRVEGKICMRFRNQLRLVRTQVGVSSVGQREMCWRL